MAAGDPDREVGRFSDRLELALRRSAEWHAGQTRRGTPTPYAAHAFAVALILDRLGFPEPVVIAGLLHDAVEDTPATLDDITREFGPEVAALVEHCSEVKLDPSGAKRPWADRKRDHLAALRTAPVAARAIVLADKLHNLRSLCLDLDAGRDVWALFHADRASVLQYYKDAAALPTDDDPRLVALNGSLTRLIAEVEKTACGTPPDG